MQLIFRKYAGRTELESFHPDSMSIVMPSGKTYYLKELDGRLEIMATDNTGSIVIYPRSVNSIVIE